MFIINSMGAFIFKLKLDVARIAYLPLLYKYRNCPDRSSIDLDVDRWIKEIGAEISGRSALVYLLRFKPQFRNLFFFRIKSHSNLLKKLCPPDSSLTIADDCGTIEGGAVYFEHAFGSHLSLNYLASGGGN